MTRQQRSDGVGGAAVVVHMNCILIERGSFVELDHHSS